ncbi:MAG TPA: zinc dependent phospholipase C family protein [Bacillus sp. (in: firmicutes)]|nr:zinc dependent phospholipase C family protein [Bacillus sp. (in: firmicutes)]
MGSRIMHYCISSIIADKMKIKNKNEFMLGGIAPDIHGLMGVPKGLTHFQDRNGTKDRHVDYIKFYKTYKDVINEPFYLGYLCHLISDEVWLDMYFKKVDYLSPEQWKEKLQTCYRDFERLNGRIIEHYSLKFLQHTIPNIDIEGYDTRFIPVLLQLISNDFVMNEELMNEQLELFNNDNSEIIEYIDKSVNESLDFVTNVEVMANNCST